MKLASLLCLIITTLGTVSSFGITRVTLANGRWHLNGEGTHPGSPAEGLLMNVRMVNATFEDRNDATHPPGFDADANTDAFIAQIPSYHAAGVRAFTLCLQGGMAGYEDALNSAFNGDGSLRQDYLARVECVIRACDERGLAVILGLFYQRQTKIFKDDDAIRAAMVKALRWVVERGFENVLIEIANEYPHKGFTHDLIRTPQGMASLLKLAKETAPDLLFTASGYGDGRLHDEVAAACDFLTPHFNGTPVDKIPERLAELKRFGKPIVCNEDDKTGANAAAALRACVENGSSYGLMLKKKNQYFPLEFEGQKDDPVFYDALSEITSPQASTAPGTHQLTHVAVLQDESALTGAHDIEIRDGLAYVAGKGFTRRNLPASGVFPYEPGTGGSLAIVDVSRPAAPKMLWFADTPLACEDAETVLSLAPGRLLVGTRDLFLFDVGDRTAPRLLAAIKDRPRVDLINGFARLGDLVFASNKAGHIIGVDVSAPDTITLLGTRETRESGELASPHDAAICGDLLVVVSPEGFGNQSRPGRLAVYRVADDAGKPMPSEQWTRVGHLEHPRLAGANRVMTRGSFAYVGSSLHSGVNRNENLRNNVSIIDFTDPANPKLRGSVDFPGERGPNGLEVAGDLVFAAGGQTVQAVEVSDPDAPRELARFTSAEAFPGAQDDAHDLVLHNGHIFVTAQTSHALVVLKWTERTTPGKP